MAQFWTLVTASALTGAFALLGAFAGGRREHGKWLRESRFEAYQALLKTGDAVTGEFLRDEFGPGEVDYAHVLNRPSRVLDAKAAVTLLGPSAVTAAAESFAFRVLQEMKLALGRREVRDAVAEGTTSTQVPESVGEDHPLKRARDGFIASARQALGSD
jgi:hypothetical protein